MKTVSAIQCWQNGFYAESPNGLNGPGAFRLLRKTDLLIAKTPMVGNDMKRYSFSLPK